MDKFGFLFPFSDALAAHVAVWWPWILIGMFALLFLAFSWLCGIAFVAGMTAFDSIADELRSFRAARRVRRGRYYRE